jgi:hypothetical protein
VSERKIGGAVLAAVGALALLEGWRLAALREEMVAGAAVGDDTLPMLVGAGLLLVAGYVLFLARWPAPSVSFPGPAERPRLLASAGLLAAYYLLAPALGYTASTLVVSTGLYRTMGGYRWWVAGLLGGATTGALYLVFRVWLLEPLPTGWFGI